MSEQDRYRLIRRVASGGMAEVLEAVAVGGAGFQRRVAIKRILPEHIADESFGRMFLDEARIASRLHHANIVAVLDFGVADGAPFQVLEFVDGVDVKALRARAGSIPPEIALHLVTEVAHALQHAHEALDESGKPLGIVHRDVSPQNILVSWSGDVKLADFGIAFAKDRTEKTESGTAKGKLSYMAPEQALGGGVDRRSDVFALGCVLHWMLAGASPLAGDDAMASLVMGGALALDPSLPDDVREIVGRATARQKIDRYADAEAMAAATGAALSKRIGRDARGVLREWLAPLKPPPVESGKQEPPLLGAELVLGDARTRAFRTRPVDRESATVAQPRRSRALPILAGSLGVIAIAAAGTWRLTHPPHAAPTPTPVAVATTAATAPPAPTPAPTKLAIAKTPAPTPRHVITPGPPTATPPPVDTRTAFLVVGGAGALKAEIFVDGASKGFAPKTLELPVGHHDVKLHTDRGIVTRAVDLDPRNTPSNPARLLLP